MFFVCEKQNERRESRWLLRLLVIRELVKLVYQEKSCQSHRKNCILYSKLLASIQIGGKDGIL